MTLETPVWIQSGSFPSRMDRLLVDTVMGAGVLDGRPDPVTVLPASTALKVAPNASTLAVDVSAGVGVIAGTDQTNQGKYVCRSTATQTVTINPRPASGQSRLDLIYAQVVDTSAGISGTDGWSLGVVTGTPSGSAPQLPAVPASAIRLAQVSVVAGTATTFAPSDITDLRVRALSRLSPIPKQFNCVGAFASGAVVAAAGSDTAIPGAELQNLVTYTPNVPVLCTGVCRADGTNTALTKIVALVGLGPTQQGTTANAMHIAVAAGASSYPSGVIVLPTPGSYWLRLQVAPTAGGGNLAVQASPFTGITLSWWDIAGPTG
ncbi:MAG TPA: hypothetical protein VGH66_02765 [Acidimicrobiales bacterium]|jgi:hypothetical protein